MTDTAVDTAPVRFERGRVQNVALWTAAITFPLFFVASFLLGFTSILVLWFLFWLGLFHWILCRWLSITQTAVRLIDYPYLVTAALGVFLIAAESHQHREKYTGQLDDIRAPPTRAGLKAHVAANIKEYCEFELKALIPESYCQWMRNLQQFVATDYSVAELRERIQQSRELADANDWGTFLAAVKYGTSRPRRTVPGSKEPIFYSPEQEIGFAQEGHVYAGGVRARLTIRSMEKVAAGLEPKAAPFEEPVPPDPADVAWGIAHVIFWPFFLSLALALRLTKTTAEVSGWVKPDRSTASERAR